METPALAIRVDSVLNAFHPSLAVSDRFVRQIRSSRKGRAGEEADAGDGGHAVKRYTLLGFCQAAALERWNAATALVSGGAPGCG